MKEDSHRLQKNELANDDLSLINTYMVAPPWFSDDGWKREVAKLRNCSSSLAKNNPPSRSLAQLIDEIQAGRLSPNAAIDYVIEHGKSEKLVAGISELRLTLTYFFNLTTDRNIETGRVFKPAEVDEQLIKQVDSQAYRYALKAYCDWLKETQQKTLTELMGDKDSIRTPINLIPAFKAAMRGNATNFRFTHIASFAQYINEALQTLLQFERLPVLSQNQFTDQMQQLDIRLPFSVTKLDLETGQPIPDMTRPTVGHNSQGEEVVEYELQREVQWKEVDGLNDCGNQFLLRGLFRAYPHLVLAYNERETAPQAWQTVVWTIAGLYARASVVQKIPIEYRTTDLQHMAEVHKAFGFTHVDGAIELTKGISLRALLQSVWKGNGSIMLGTGDQGMDVAGEHLGVDHIVRLDKTPRGWQLSDPNGYPDAEPGNRMKVTHLKMNELLKAMEQSSAVRENGFHIIYSHQLPAELPGLNLELDADFLDCNPGASVAVLSPNKGKGKDVLRTHLDTGTTAVPHAENSSEAAVSGSTVGIERLPAPDVGTAGGSFDGTFSNFPEEAKQQEVAWINSIVNANLAELGGILSDTDRHLINAFAEWWIDETKQSITIFLKKESNPLNVFDAIAKTIEDFVPEDKQSQVLLRRCLMMLIGNASGTDIKQALIKRDRELIAQKIVTAQSSQGSSFRAYRDNGNIYLKLLPMQRCHLFTNFSTRLIRRKVQGIS